MKKILKNSFNILKNNPLFVQPILLFLLLIMSAIPYLVSQNTNIYAKSILGFSIVLMAIAFNAGFYRVVKLSNETYNEEDDKETINEKSMNNFKSFFTGVTEGFLKYSFALPLLFLIYSGIVALISYLGLKFLGTPEFLNSAQNELTKISTNEQMTEFLQSISDKDKAIISAWTLSITIISAVLNFVVTLYLTVLAFAKNNNIFIAFFNTLKFIFKHFLGAITMIGFMFALYFGLNLLSMILPKNPISLFLITLLLVYYFSFYIIAVSNFYYEKTKDNSNSGTECIG